MRALKREDRTVGGMTPCTGSACADALVENSRTASSEDDVLGAVVEALGTAGRGEWAVLEAWVAAITEVAWAALRAVSDELHEFL